MCTELHPQTNNIMPEMESDVSDSFSVYLSGSEQSCDLEVDSEDSHEETLLDDDGGIRPYQFEPYQSDSSVASNDDSAPSSPGPGPEAEQAYPEHDINCLQNTEW